jgi:hypothetical protein
MRALAQGDGIATGDNDGVESVVRAFAETAEIPILVVPTPINAETGKPDWDDRHRHLGEDTAVVAVHADPHDSSVVKSLFAILADDRVRLVTLTDVL